MKSLLTLHIATLRSAAQICSIGIALDVDYIKLRWEEEGDSFLTITLPKFAKTLERALDTGFWPAQEPLGFKRIRGLPTFMSGFLSRIFHKNGTLLDDPDTDCIWAVRQVCYLSHKIGRECTPERVQAAFDQFVRTDRELLGLPGRLDPARLKKFRTISQKLFGDLFSSLETKVANFDLIPKHGPGAVAESISQKEKRNYDYWTERLEQVFPQWRYTSNSVYPATMATPVPFDTELPVRVITVPKTQSTPRIISIEPSTVQYAQQGLKREIYEGIGRSTLEKVLGFQDQSRNQNLAQKASVDHSMATLDLSEASDRVHWFLVKVMLERWPHLWDFVWATRSHRAQIPGEGVIPLQKFASMGSALTFPFEAMIFTILSVCGIESSRNSRLSVRDLPGLLSVYGDDIVIPIDTVDCVVDWLEHFGAKVNQAKSFWSGSFRESCGSEYYNGTDVSVVRIRHELPSSRSDATEIAALVDLRNRSYLAGLWVLVADIDEELESLIRLPKTKVTPEDTDATIKHESVGYLTQFTFLDVVHRVIRWNSELHYYTRRVPVLRPRGTKYRVDGEAGLLEWFHDSLRQKDLVDRFDSQERPTSFSIQRRGIEI